MKRTLTLLSLLLCLLGTSATAAFAHDEESPVEAVRDATEPLRQLAYATHHGYDLRLADKNNITCIDNPAGAMGVHYVNGGLVGDGMIDALKPDVLVYEPRRNGRMRLVAVEYVVFQDSWDASHDAPPSLFGHRFELLDGTNRYGLPAFYELHAWIWKHNPSGMFADWNPRVTCAYG